MAQPEVADERTVLLASLSEQRDHVLGILEGLSGEDLRRPVLPSGWSCLGLVHHLALDVERFWFRAVVAGDQDVIDTLDEGDAWQVGPQIAIGEVFALYRQEIEQANGVITTTSLDAPPAWWPAFFDTFRMHTLREIILHVITETACHAGHADVVRELIDGRRWIVLTQ
jgi:uncharacterized damage-inducible protein DinB